MASTKNTAAKTPKTQVTKAAETQARKRFFYVRTKTAKFGFMTGKAENLEDALKQAGEDELVIRHLQQKWWW